MSIFKTRGIILKIHKNNQKDLLYTIFTQDYGKIYCQKKFSNREKIIDIGYCIGFEIETKNGSKFHKMRNIKILEQIGIENSNFAFINGFLESIALLNKLTPESYPYNGIIDFFESFYAIHKHQYEKTLLLKACIYKYFGILGETNNDPVVEKILKFIHTQHPLQVMKIKNIAFEQQKKLEELFKTL